MTAIIKLEYHGSRIDQRDSDRYLNATQMAKANGKQFNDYARLSNTKAFLGQLVIETGIPVSKLVVSIKGGRVEEQGTWVHPLVAIHYGQWLSPEFAVWVSNIIYGELEKRAGHANLPAEVLSLVERTDGIVRMLAKKVTAIETIAKKSAEETAKEYVARQQFSFRSGKTAGQIWNEFGLPRIKNAPTWLGNRLSENGAEMEGRAEAGGRTARLYDPDKARACMKNGLLHKCKRYADSRQGQGHLKLVGD